jgi:hypothetical protein
VVPECCILCGIPEEIAPELFRTGEDHCFFLRQPRSRQEVDAAIEAMLSSEVDCIRYGGADPEIMKRIGRAGVASQADHGRPNDYAPLVKDRVEFSFPDPRGEHDLADRFRSDLSRNERYTVGFSFRRRAVRFAWWNRNFHVVEFEPFGDAHRVILKPSFPEALLGVARVVDEWLRAAGARDIAWRTRDGDEEASPDTPWPF